MSEYPDPDIAANATSYPWTRYDNDARPDGSRRSPHFDPFVAEQTSPSQSSQGVEAETSDIDDLLPQNNDDGGSNYDTVMEDAESDEFMSEENLDEDSDVIPGAALPQLSSSIARQIGQEQKPQKPGASVQRKGRNLSSRKSGSKSKKRGHRKPIEPGLDFTAEFSQATMAFTNGDFENAELYTLKALQLNPEVFQAHNLLSEIHAARGDHEKAINAAWNGAHTRPRDTKMWSRVASLILEQGGEGRESRLKDALYCYSRIISVEKHNIEARHHRAAINRELGHKRKVIAEYEYLLRLLPHDMSILRHLADIYIEMNAADKALQHYEVHATQACGQCDETRTSLTWSDLNIIAELYIILRSWKDGLLKIRRLCRRLLGRRDDVIWDCIESDDREWDLDDEPRRVKTPGFIIGAYERVCYGEGLPLELRVKLGTLRLLSDNNDMEEALFHFSWLEPEDQSHGARVHDFSDLFREAALALKGKHRYEDALRYLLPLLHQTNSEDVSILMEVAACYRLLGLVSKAEECYKAILDLDECCTEARIALWNLDSNLRGQGMQVSGSKTNLSGTKPGNMSSKRGANRNGRLFSNLERSTYFQGLGDSNRRDQFGRLDSLDAAVRNTEVSTLFSRRRHLRSAFENTTSNTDAWFEATRLLLQVFCDNRVFFPSERSTRFYGYSREARMFAKSRKQEQNDPIHEPLTTFVSPDGDEIEIPVHYRGVHFTEWLDVFLENAVELTKNGKPREAYSCISDALSANIFYHSADAMLLIHVCWFACALLANDEEAVYSVARWFMTRFQFVTDSYHLFAALNRLCDSDNEWYNSSPSQKYILRQLKAMDFSFLTEGRRKTIFQERASYTTKDSSGKGLPADDLDVALLMLYGHILYAGKSYAFAINYFLRALSLDTHNTAIKLSLALAYGHWALKRQAENRHHILVQALSFLTEYYQEFQSDQRPHYQRQEAEFNMGRMYHLLGLMDLAIPHYELCLALGSEINEGLSVENFAYEAAFALQSHWAAQGDFRRAKRIIKDWLVL